MPDRAEQHSGRIVEFFDAEYRWWSEVYTATLPRGFFSFEMLRRRELVVALLEKYAATGAARILECGCGPGGILGAFSGSGCQVTGIDLNLRHLRTARSTLGKEIAWIQADVEALPFPAHSFDIVLCVGVLSYLQEDEAAVAELSRVVKPGGVVLVALPNWWMLNKLFDPYYYLVWLPGRLRQWWATRGAPPAAPAGKFAVEMIRRYRPAQIAAVFQRHGLQELEHCSVSFGPLTFWRREFLSLRWSIRLSEALLALDRKSGCSLLRQVSSHWITCLTKTSP